MRSLVIPNELPKKIPYSYFTPETLLKKIAYDLYFPDSRYGYNRYILARIPLTYELVSLLEEVLPKDFKYKEDEEIHIRAELSLDKDPLGVTIYGIASLESFGAGFYSKGEGPKLLSKVLEIFPDLEIPKVMYELSQTDDCSLLKSWEEVGYPGLANFKKLRTRFFEGENFSSLSNVNARRQLANSFFSPFEPDPFDLSLESLYFASSVQEDIIATWEKQLEEYKEEL